MAVRVVSDSACDLPPETCDALGIEIVPLTIRFGDDEYVDRTELSTEDFWRKLESSTVLPETAAPSVGAFEETFRGPPLPADAAHAESHLRNARALADALEIPVGDAVDFWTEAALFSQAGCTTFVYGPGDIAQAHSADEWVGLDQLEAAARTYLRIVEKSS